MRKNLLFRIQAALLAGALVVGAAAFTETTLCAETDEYVYCLASVSKIYSTAAVMQLVEQGKVGLDDPITMYISDFKMADERYKDITVRMLMDHTSGIQGTTYFGVFLYGQENPLRRETLLDTLAGQRLRSTPGEYSAYCNDGFDLLALIVEKVTGMDYTEYIKKYVASPTGGSSTSSGEEVSKITNLAPGFGPGGVLYENDACMAIGGGGIYATASDTANFGAGFFKNADSLLSKESKDAMATRWQTENSHMDGNGLGWDSVESERYENAGVKVLGKGGDVSLNHTYLMVAPEEEISIAVLSNGGNSMLDEMVARAIMDVCLEESGITVEDESLKTLTMNLDVPSSYDKYAGDYVINGESGWDTVRVTFPEHKYMHVENIGPLRSGSTDYVLTDEGYFARLAYEVEDSGLDDIKIASKEDYMNFEEDSEGHVYITVDRKENLPELGVSSRNTYGGQKLEHNAVSAETLGAWAAACDSEYVLAKDAYNSETFNQAFVNLGLSEDVPGYLYVVTGMGTRVLKIVDAGRAEAFTTLPASTNRDLIDVNLSNGGLMVSNGWQLIPVNGLPEFDSSLKEIELKAGEASWFRIGESAVNTDVVMASRPEDSAVYVYNKYGEAIYSSHIIGSTNILPMPKDGKIMFISGSDGKVTLN